MNKKYLLSLIGLMFAIPFVSVFADNTFTRTPTGLNVISPLSYDVVITVPYCTTDFWGLGYQNEAGDGYQALSDFVSTTITENTFIKSFPVGTKISNVDLICTDDINVSLVDAFNLNGESLENMNGDWLTIIAPPTGDLITLPAGLTTGLTDNASSLFGDIAPYLLIIIGIPFGIYIIKKVLSLIPKK
jgi:hypothetical protein